MIHKAFLLEFFCIRMVRISTIAPISLDIYFERNTRSLRAPYRQKTRVINTISPVTAITVIHIYKKKTRLASSKNLTEQAAYSCVLIFSLIYSNQQRIPRTVGDPRDAKAGNATSMAGTYIRNAREMLAP